MYYRPETREVFVTHSDIRGAMPNVIFEQVISDEALAYCGVFPLTSMKPVAPAGQVAAPLAIDNIDGAWTQLWTMRDATPEEMPNETEIVAACMAAAQAHMDARAMSFGYDNLISVITYAEEPSVARYQAEGQAFRAWRSACWRACEQMLAAVKAGERSAPTHDELLAALPALDIAYPGPFGT